MPSGISYSNPQGSRLLPSFQLPVPSSFRHCPAVVPSSSRRTTAPNGHTSRQFPHRMQCSFCISKGTCAVVIHVWGHLERQFPHPRHCLVIKYPPASSLSQSPIKNPFLVIGFTDKSKYSPCPGYTKYGYAMRLSLSGYISAI